MSHQEEVGEETEEEETETDRDHNSDSDETDLESDLEPIILNKRITINTTGTTTTPPCANPWKKWQTELVRDNMSKLWGPGWKALEDAHETFVIELLGKLNDGQEKTNLTRKQLYDKVRRLRRDGIQAEPSHRKRRSSSKPRNIEKQQKLAPLAEPETEGEGLESLRHQRDLLRDELNSVTRKHQAIYASLKEACRQNDRLLNRMMVLVGERNAFKTLLRASTAEGKSLLDDHMLAESMTLNLRLAKKDELVKMVLDLTAERDAARNEIKAIAAEKEGLLKENRELLARVDVFKGTADTLTQGLL
ncbi:hypothetical protein K440DRAFT_632856 [Wilcoxina mikolae CBS 423.85]|nr:hypothetical protein K440DRAFT_632856 [Wilcoxina mikolae CBS 423.85]